MLTVQTISNTWESIAYIIDGAWAEIICGDIACRVHKVGVARATYSIAKRTATTLALTGA
jgi:hypothetical protein